MRYKGEQRVVDDKRKREQRSRIAREESERLALLCAGQEEVKAEAERIGREKVEAAVKQTLQEAFEKARAVGTIKARVEYAKLARELRGD